MKLKFKATAQDWMIFGLFALLLLIVVSILVNNIHSFATMGTFAGLNPFTAIIHNFAAVLVFYAFAMIFLFAMQSHTQGLQVRHCRLVCIVNLFHRRIASCPENSDILRFLGW